MALIQHSDHQLLLGVHKAFSNLILLHGNDVAVGIALTLCEVHHTKNPWLTPNFIAKRMVSVSVDTVRRRLEALVDTGLAEFIENDGRRLYRATPEACAATVKVVREAFPAVRFVDSNLLPQG